MTANQCAASGKATEYLFDRGVVRHERNIKIEFGNRAQMSCDIVTSWRVVNARGRAGNEGGDMHTREEN